MVPTSTAGLPRHIPIPPKQLPPQRVLACTPSESLQAEPSEETVELPSTPFSSSSAVFQTTPNVRKYISKPARIPEDDVELDDLCDSLAFHRTLSSSASVSTSSQLLQQFGSLVANAAAPLRNPYHPFANITIYPLVKHNYSSLAGKSNQDTDALVKNVFLQDDFKQEHLVGYTTARELKWLDEREDGDFPAEDGWRQASVNIPLPKEGVRFSSEDEAPTFEIKGLVYRPLLETLKKAYQDPTAQLYHWSAHELFWRRPLRQPSNSRSSSQSPSPEPTGTSTSSTASTAPPSSSSGQSSSQRAAPPNFSANAESNAGTARNPPAEFEDVRVWSEVYNSDIMHMLKEEAALRAQPRNPEDPPDIEYAVAPIFFYSDATRLANFGNQSLWPIYMYVASLSKYFRCKPGAFAAHHIAYMPSVSVTYLHSRQSMEIDISSLY